MQVQTTIASAIKKILDINEVPFNVPPKREFGDFSTAVCMPMAKVRRTAPIKIAQEVKEKLDALKLPYIKEIIVTPPGYLNFKIDHPAYVKSVLDKIRSKGEDYGKVNVGRARRVLIEHTNVNPNKAMHIGHLRNCIIGDTVVRTLRKLGYDVQACNYIDDTGVQVADVVVAMLYMDAPKYKPGMDLAKIWAKYDGKQSFDYWCWDIYSRVAAAYDTDEKLKANRAEVLHAVESCEGEIAAFAKEVATRIVTAHLKTVGRLNVTYNLLNWESDIFHRGFWNTAFELLKKSGAVVFETEGPNKGCWVVRFGRGVFMTDEGLKSEDKVLVRSNGTVTYTGKDIAYQMWKFGVLGRDFLYKNWGKQIDGTMLKTTAPDGKSSKLYGRADKVINVIDIRQAYTQEIVYSCLRKLGFPKQSRNSVHLGYEVVVLSANAAKTLGMETESGGAQAMSGRKGLGVKGDDLINVMAAKLAEKGTSKKSAEILSAGAIRYFMSKITTGKMIVFDFDEALRTTGDSGIYCEYAHARACSVLAKAGIKSFRGVKVPDRVTETEENLIKKLDEFPAVVRKAGADLSPAPLARYAFDLASCFTDYYETPDPEAEKQTPFYKIEDKDLKKYRLALVDAFRATMANCLTTLGITPLERI
ncbi:MAG: arginine--tRNA ligase [Abditibacteriota bacterium]|nr:arginine--tRNA ligase [Abditibacteriota bacterium]